MRAEVALTLSTSIVSFLLLLYHLPILIIILALIRLYSSGHLPSCDMEEEIVSHTTFLTSIFLPGCFAGAGVVGTCPGELSAAPSRDRPGELPSIRMDMSSG